MKGISKPQVVEVFASASRGTTTSGVTDIQDNNALNAQLDVTAKTGTNPTLDVLIQDAPTANGPWSTLLTFTQATDVTNEMKSAVPTATTRAPMPFVRGKGTVGGTATPKFTYTLNIVAYKL